MVGRKEMEGESGLPANPEWNHNGSFLEDRVMPTTITLKNVPDRLYERIRQSAQSNRRSINSEILIRLEAALLPMPSDPETDIARARAIRESLGPRRLGARDIDRFKREGRE